MNIGDFVTFEGERVQVWDIKRTARGPMAILAIPTSGVPTSEWTLVGAYLTDEELGSTR